MAKKAARGKAVRRKRAPAAAERVAEQRPQETTLAPVPVEAAAPVLPEDLDPLQFIKEFDSQLDVLLDIKQSLESDLAGTHEQIARFRRRNEETMEHLQELETEVQRQASVRNEVEFLQGETAKTTDELKTARGLLEEKAVAATRKDERIEKFQADKQAMRDEINALKEQQSQLRNERAETDSHLQVAKLERNEMLLEIRKLQDVLVREEERAQSAEAELEQARMALSKLHGSFEVSKRKAERILKK
jgi:chromosome segregation ATPase